IGELARCAKIVFVINLARVVRIEVYRRLSLSRHDRTIGYFICAFCVFSWQSIRMESVRVNKRGADRVRQGHLWIYRSDVVEVNAKGGAVVSVKDERGNFVGQALFTDSSQIALRFLTL